MALARNTAQQAERAQARPAEDACEIAPSPVESAREAGLRYITDAKPGIRRRRVGKHFTYIGLDGKPIHDEQELERIRHIGIPPAWTDVWICPSPRGHIQATGRDAKGRKQYRYHPRWREVRDETKYDRLIAFAEALPRIRQRVEHDLALPGLPREKVLATVVRLLDLSTIRVGNEEYARENQSFGLTTLHNEHVSVSGERIHFHFRGKSGKEHTIDVRDRQLARIVKRCQDLPGEELFEYLDADGQQCKVTSDDINAYLREVSGEDFTAKDFRTWAGTVFVTQALQELGPAENKTQAKKQIVSAIKNAAAQLGNTPAICRKCYVHPAILEAYADGTLLPRLQELRRRSRRHVPHDLSPEEAAVLAFLQ